MNTSRIDQLSGNEIIFYMNNDTLSKIESIGGAKAIFFNNNSDDADGLFESTAEKIIIQLKDGQANTITLIKEVPGKYHPEQFVSGKEIDFYLPNYRKADNSPQKPKLIRR